MSTEYRITDAKQLATLLRGYRRTRNLTQSEVAERLGIAQQSYARIEKQPTTTSVSNLIKVMAVLGIDLVMRERTLIPESVLVSQIPPKKPEKTKTAQKTLSNTQILTGEIPPLKNKRDW